MHSEASPVEFLHARPNDFFDFISAFLPHSELLVVEFHRSHGKFQAVIKVTAGIYQKRRDLRSVYLPMH